MVLIDTREDFDGRRLKHVGAKEYKILFLENTLLLRGQILIALQELLTVVEYNLGKLNPVLLPESCDLVVLLLNLGQKTQHGYGGVDDIRVEGIYGLIELMKLLIVE
jgi:hypothetical protein